MNDTRKSTLLITYDWLPSAEVGAVRVQKIAQCLCEHGWHPIILTVKELYYERVFKEKEPSSFETLRTSCIPSPLKAYAYAKTAIGRLRTPKRLDVVNSMKSIELKQSHRAKTPIAYARRLILSILFMPDEFLGWLPPAVLKGISTIKAHRISHVITSGPPFTTHLIGLVLKKWKGKHIRWIADFRDPWVANEQRTAHVTTSVSNYFNRLLEMQVITNADKVVCVTPSMTDWYRKRYPLVSDSVWQTITNGFESKEFNEIKLDRVRKRFTISYIGSIEYERSPVGLFRAVSELCREGVVDNRRISINFVGKCGAVEGRTITELIRQWNLEGIVQLMGLIPRSEALREMKSSHVLLLLANAQRLQVPGKAYEYMAAGPFILAVTEEHGATADFIRRVGGGAIVSSNDHQTLKAVLHNCYGEFIRRPLETINYGVSRPATILNEYAWNHLGERYARILVEG